MMGKWLLVVSQGLMVVMADKGRWMLGGPEYVQVNCPGNERQTRRSVAFAQLQAALMSLQGYGGPQVLRGRPVADNCGASYPGPLGRPDFNDVPCVH